LLLLLPRSTLFPYTTLFRSHGFIVSIAGRNAAAQSIHYPRHANFCYWFCFDGGASKRDRRQARKGHCIRKVWPISARFRMQWPRSEEHTSELQSLTNLLCPL